MSVAILITDENQIDDVLDWGEFLADCESAELIVLVLRKNNGERQWVQLDAASYKAKDEQSSLIKALAARLFESDGSSLEPSPQTDNTQPEDETSEVAEPGPSSPATTIRILNDKQPEWALVDEISSLDIKLLILPEVHVGKSASQSESWIKSLYQQAPCETMQVRSHTESKREGLRILVVTTGLRADTNAIQRGLKIAKCSNGELSAIYFQPDIDTVAREVGRNILVGIVENSIGQDASTHLHVQLANTVREGLSQMELDSYDLILCGTRNDRESAKFLSIPALRDEKLDLCVATVRKPIPLANRFVNNFQTWIEGFIPQLKRHQRIELVKRIQTSAKWDFDFGMLISLSTLIAALGLIRNSASVVIGAMLVAPLMTPIVGMGLGLAQSNNRLVRNSMRSIWRGFATALLIGAIVGLLTNPEITSEMAARGSPNFLDMVVALVSGIAAAYALGRPNLLSALPGVAIAAALVPPLATSGIALSQGELHLSYGALLLFCTNIVAIILGTAFTFWTVGIRQDLMDPKSRAWPLWVFFAVVLLCIGLTVMMSLNNLTPE